VPQRGVGVGVGDSASATARVDLFQRLSHHPPGSHDVHSDKSSPMLSSRWTRKQPKELFCQGRHTRC
jgi:hypothetical protein